MHHSRYDDIIRLPRPTSSRASMSVDNRAAQFAPFAALHGHEEAIDETARLTDRMIELEDDQKQAINAALCRLVIGRHLAAIITYFIPDAHKDGGRYVTINDTVRRVDDYRRCLILDSGSEVAFERLLNVEIIP